jgi:hypothetical protein
MEAPDADKVTLAVWSVWSLVADARESATGCGEIDSPATPPKSTVDENPVLVQRPVQTIVR